MSQAEQTPRQAIALTYDGQHTPIMDMYSELA